jgi:sigma-B regulation protein RsbU (phosphoserine phosphatase)
MTGRLQQLIAEVKEKEKIHAELDIARRVQIELLPKLVPRVPSLELAGLCLPSRFVSGDYYDFVSLDDRWTVVAVGDISKKGIAAALVMATVQAALHAQLKFVGQRGAAWIDDVPPIAALMERLSEQIYDSTPGEKYATFFCSAYDDRNGRFVYTNAGHLPPILVRDGQAGELEVSGMVIGLLPVFSYEQQSIDLQKGDLLAIFSDAVTEAENEAGEQFETQRLKDLLIRHADKPLNDIIGIVTDLVSRWASDRMAATTLPWCWHGESESRWVGAPASCGLTLRSHPSIDLPSTAPASKC